MKIVVLDGYTENPGDLSWQGFEALGELTVYDRTPFTEGNAEILARAKGAGAVIVNKTPLSAETIAALAPELQYIGVLATGYNVIDTQAAATQGVPVCNIPTYGTPAVAQFTMALLLELCHHVGDHAAAVQAGEWARCPDFSFWKSPLVELQGKTFGAVGFGRIGQAAGSLARAFGMRVLAHDAFVKESDFAELVPLPELLAQSDVVSLHCPLTSATRHLINEESIRRMKDGAFLLNTSRGPLVDEAALAAALHSGKLAGAGLDVLETEPPLPASPSPLLGAPHCLVTPHIAWAPRESRQRLMDVAVENLRHFQAGSPQNRVN